MRVEIRKQFVNNLKGIKSVELADDIEHLIELTKAASNITELPGLKKLTGHDDFYRIRIDDYRVGVKLSGSTVIFVCLYHRSVIYKLFP